MSFQAPVFITDNPSEIVLPSRATSFSCGYDLRCPYELTLYPKQKIKIATGIKVIMPFTMFILITIHEFMVEKGLVLFNGVSIINADYKDEICLLLENTNSVDYIHIKEGQKIAQAIFQRYETTFNDY